MEIILNSNKNDTKFTYALPNELITLKMANDVGIEPTTLSPLNIFICIIIGS